MAAAKMKLAALCDSHLELEASSQRAVIACLGRKLTAAHSELQSAERAEETKAQAAEQMHKKAQESDEKAERLRITAVSLSKGVEEMKEVRRLRTDALSLKQRSEVLKEMCQHLRKQATDAQEKVCFHSFFDHVQEQTLVCSSHHKFMEHCCFFHVLKAPY
jgi:translation initiation factor 2B subunit (eIF-2B alpha/beta/delta family)